MENELKPIVTISTPNLANVTSDSITINWDYEIESASPEDIRFEVAVKGEMADGTPWIRIEAPEKNTCTITGLKPDTKYSIFVVAIHENEDIAQAPDSDDGVVVTTTKRPRNWKKIGLIAGCALAAIALGVLLFFLLRDTKAPVLSNPELISTIQDDAVALTWSKAEDNATEVQDLRYFAYRTDEAGVWMDPLEILGDTTCTFSGLKPWTDYKFRVEAWDKKGNKAPYTEISVKTTDSVAPEIPEKALTPDVGDDKIVISWSPASDNVTGQKEMRYLAARTDETGAWIEPHEVQGDTSYAFTGLNPRVTYSLRVEAVDDAGNRSPYDDLSVATTDSSIPVLEDAKLVAEPKDNEIALKWKPATDNVTGPQDLCYEISRTNDAGNWLAPIRVKGETSYVFTGLKTKSNYLFKVVAFDEAGNSNQYEVLTTATIDSGAPDVNDKRLNSRLYDDKVTVLWVPATDKGTTDPKSIRYRVSRTNESGAWLTPQEIRGQTSYTFEGLRSKVPYTFRVEAFDESNNMSRYNDLRVTTTDTKAPVVGSKTVTATDIKQNSFTLTWKPASDVNQVTPSSKIRYRVYLRPSSSSKWTVTHDLTGKTSYSATGLLAKTTYFFKVEAYDESNNYVAYVRENGNPFTATTTDTTNPTVPNKTVNHPFFMHNWIRLNWKDAKDNVTPTNKIRYRVYYRESISGYTYSSIDVGTNTDCTLGNLKPNTTYDFYVLAIDESGNTATYSVASQKTRVTPINKLFFDIEQEATPLYGTNTISFTMTYRYVKRDSNGQIQDLQTGKWEQKWSNKDDKRNNIIELPYGFYFEDNTVHVVLESRKNYTTSWKKCRSGDVDIKDGHLKFRLVGNHNDFNIRFSGNASAGYAQFK